MKKSWLIGIGVLVGLVLLIVIVFGIGGKEESKDISKITIGGFSLDGKLPDDIDEYLLLDAYIYTYLYDNIYIGVDENDKIYALGFFRSKYSDDTVIVDYSDINVMYDGSRLQTLKDFEDCFGEGVKENNLIKYTSETASLTLELENDEIINIELTRKSN